MKSVKSIMKIIHRILSAEMTSKIENIGEYYLR